MESGVFADIDIKQQEMKANERRVEKEMAHFRHQINGFAQQFSQWESAQKGMLHSAAELGNVQEWARHVQHDMDEVGEILNAVEGSMAGSSDGNHSDDG
jgi:hypothetical protein